MGFVAGAFAGRSLGSLMGEPEAFIEGDGAWIVRFDSQLTRMTPALRRWVRASSIIAAAMPLPRTSGATASVPRWATCAARPRYRCACIEALNATFYFEYTEAAAVEQRIEYPAEGLAGHRVGAEKGHRRFVHMDVEDPVEIGWDCVSAHVTFLGAFCR